MAQFLEANEPHIYNPIPLEGAKERFNEYEATYRRSLNESDSYWKEMAEKYITWFQPFTNISAGGFTDGDIRWFENGKLNACYNCVDRHLPHKADETALIWESDEAQDSTKVTYKELLQRVCKVANVLMAQGVKKGDVVTIYLPMIPEVVYTVLACARIGAVHSVVFAGFSADSLRDRILDCNSKHVLTANIGRRGGRSIELQTICAKAVSHCPDVTSVMVFSYPNTKAMASHPKEMTMDSLLPQMRPYTPPIYMDSEDPLFILYTSGSTGKPKGVMHSTGGYMVNVAMTTQTSFGIKEGDVYCCMADAGWITGHSYIIYGPLSLGTTTLLFEGVPLHPTPYRYWEVIEKYKGNILYTAPTAIRALMRHPPQPIHTHTLTSLRVLGTVGEVINPEAWGWWYTNAGQGRCSIVDTYWQTETGAHIAANIPGVMPMVPGSCALPYHGVEACILDPHTGRELPGSNVEGVLCLKRPWPSIARTVWGDHERYLNVYMKPYPGYYFTGDGARRDAGGYLHITGRVDDVLNPSGHRLGTAEVESALLKGSKDVSEAAVVGFPHDIKGEGIGCFVILKEGVECDGNHAEELRNKLKLAVRVAIGPIATPDFIVFGDLPKTRSGKIMRRILRKIASGEEDSIGDVSTLADPSVVQKLVERFRDVYDKK